MLLLLTTALAAVDVKCESAVNADPPGWYVDDPHQQAWALNRFAASTSISPMGAGIPRDERRLELSVELDVVPPVGCERRFYSDRTATLDMNHSLVLPRLRADFASNPTGKLVVYGAVAWTPPLDVDSARTTSVGGHVGAGFAPTETTLLSARLHFTQSHSTVHFYPPADIANPLIRDYLAGSALGADVVAGAKLGAVTPYLSAGWLDTSTFAWVGENSDVMNNYAPYSGLALAVGTEIEAGPFASAVEFYAVPGVLYTVRLRGGLGI